MGMALYSIAVMHKILSHGCAAVDCRLQCIVSGLIMCSCCFGKGCCKWKPNMKLSVCLSVVYVLLLLHD
jgi:hypothetical protein